MNCTRVLHAFSHSQAAVIPADLAMCLSLSQRQPLYQLLSMSPLKPTLHRCQSIDYPPKTSLRSLSSSSLSLASSHVPSVLRSCLRRDRSGLNKKRVVFADVKGLALTAVRLFIPELSSPTPALMMAPSPAKPDGQQSTPNKLQRQKLRLGFPQPTLDFKAFLAHLREMNVQLESCNISEHSLSGKVCVSHVSTGRTVHIRVTFDSWRSHRDIPCTFLQQQRCGGSDVDVFTFELSLPDNVDPKERMEFCVSFRPAPGSTPHWDNNRGQNYRVYVEKDGSSVNQGSDSHCFTLSKYRPPSWPSQVAAGVQNSANQYLRRSLSGRVRAEWKTLVAVQ